MIPAPSSIDGVMIVRTLVKESVPLGVENLSDQEQVINKGTELGWCEAFQSVHTPRNNLGGHPVGDVKKTLIGPHTMLLPAARTSSPFVRPGWTKLSQTVKFLSMITIQFNVIAIDVEVVFYFTSKTTYLHHRSPATLCLNSCLLKSPPSKALFP